MYKRSIGGWAKHWDFILIDTICLQIALHLAYFFRFGSFGLYSGRSAYRTSGFVLIFLSVIVAILFNTMHNVLKRDIWEEIKNTVIQCGLVFSAIIILLFSSKDSDHVSRIVLYVTMGLYIILTFITRLLYRRIVISHKRNAKGRELLLVGDEAGIITAMKAFKAYPEEGISVKGIILLGQPGREINGVSVVADKDHAAEYIRNEWIDEVYIACNDYSLLPDQLISQCDEMAITVHQQMLIKEDVKGVQWVEKIAKQPVLTTSIRIPKPRELMVKRTIDIIAGFFMSIAALIVLLVVTPIIKIKTPGPVLLKQERIGRNGKKFKEYTIRTMYMDADRRMKNWREINGDEKPAARSDPRIIGNVNGKTGIGFNLRQWGFDDLPKGFNVLLGSMSLVGTRAPSVSEWERYENRHRARLSCKPGITGLWQASGQSRTMSFEEATKLDTEYIANWSIGLDLKILFRTVGAENRRRV